VRLVYRRRPSAATSDNISLDIHCISRRCSLNADNNLSLLAVMRNFLSLPAVGDTVRVVLKKITSEKSKN